MLGIVSVTVKYCTPGCSGQGFPVSLAIVHKSSVVSTNVMKLYFACTFILPLVTSSPYKDLLIIPTLVVFTYLR